MNPDQNAYKEQVPPAPLLMSQLLLHSPLLMNSSHRRMIKQVILKLGRDFTTEEEEEARRKRREEWSVLLFSSAQRLSLIHI